jgi:formate C-acetyltransferase
VLILLAASQRHILRYATLAAEMARRCDDPQRREELETIAAHSRHNAGIARKISGRPASCSGT